MFGKLFDKLMEKSALDLDSWNTIGRKVVAHDSAELTKFHQGKSEAPTFMSDTRSPALAEAVLEQVVALNAAGKGRQARDLFDPAHSPFIPKLEEGGRGLECCAILGADDFLVQQGTVYQGVETWRIKDDAFHPIDNVMCFAWSQNREHFVTAHSDGSISIGDTFNAGDAVIIPAPDASDFIPTGLTSLQLEKFETPSFDATYLSISISDRGDKVLICDAYRGVLLLSKVDDNWRSDLLLPSLSLGLSDEMKMFEEDGEDYSPFFDMLHSALSPDGNFAALGTQDAGHYVVRLDAFDGPTYYATLGYLSEYPHNACFSDDSAFVAFNSCHFYNGMTFASALRDIHGLDTSPYEKHDVQTVLNDYLRVYTSTFLPQSMTASDSGAFILAGASFAACVTPAGELQWEIGFGSSAGGVDVCPETGRVLLSSHSGMLHLLEPTKPQSVLINSGYNSPNELQRWVFWDRLDAPIIW
jgi:hypothetical protein